MQLIVCYRQSKDATLTQQRITDNINTNVSQLSLVTILNILVFGCYFWLLWVWEILIFSATLNELVYWIGMNFSSLDFTFLYAYTICGKLTTVKGTLYLHRSI
jgi:hypothetical protein